MEIRRPPGVAGAGTAPRAPGATSTPGPTPRTETRSFVEVLGESRGPPPSGAQRPRAAGPVPASARASPARLEAPSPVPQAQKSWQRLVDGAFTAEKRLDATIEAARLGKTFTASELIALQADVFRYCQTVEVVSRTTDKLVGALKQLLSTQV